MGNYIVKRNVPIIDEHVMYDDDGNPVMKIDEKRLRYVAAHNNRRIKDTGDLIPLVIGHTKDDAGEQDQPELVGYAKDLKVLPFRKTGRKAIFATFYYRKDKVQKARDFPRRSIELWLSDWKIDPISLLGATTPERDLGLVQLSKSGSVIQFAKDGKRVYKRVMKDPPRANVGGKRVRKTFYKGGQFIPAANTTPNHKKEDEMDEKAIVAAVLKALEQTSVWKWAEEQMRHAEANEDGMEGDPMLEEGLEEEQMPDEMEPVLDGEVHEDEGESLPEEEAEADGREEEPVQYSMEGSCPSGDNVYTPGERSFKRDSKEFSQSREPSHSHKHQINKVDDMEKIRKKGKDAPAHKPAGVAKMARKSNDLVRFQRQLSDLAKENKDLRIRYQRSERERDLMVLAAQGYEFDPEEELNDVAEMPDAEYGRHIDRIRKRYQRSPVGDPRFDLAASRGTLPTPSAGRSRDEAMAIAKLAQKKGISYQEALESQDNAEQVY